MIDQYDTNAIQDDWIPAEQFRDPRRDELEAAQLWPRVWQVACRESELPDIGSFVRYDILDDSILIVRTGPEKKDVIAYYNVCQHRGRELKEAAHGQLGATIACRFHGWQWKIDGSLHSVYREEDWKGCSNFTREALKLPPVKVGFWGGWVWINQDPNAAPLLDFLGVVPEYLDPFDFDSLYPVYWKTIIAPVNWKIVTEAFNEAYHAWATHNTGINYFHRAQPTVAHGLHAMAYGEPAPEEGEYLSEEGKWKKPATKHESIWANLRHVYRTLGAMTLEPGMAAAERLKQLPDDTPPEHVFPTYFALHREEIEKRGATFPPNLTMEALGRAGFDWHIFPNSVVLPTIDGALWYRMRPHRDRRDHCIFDIWSFGRFAPGQEPHVVNEVSNGFEEFKGQCAFLEEDFSNLVAVQRGVRNRGFRGARTNPRQEGTITNFHRQLDAWCGVNVAVDGQGAGSAAAE